MSRTFIMSCTDSIRKVALPVLQARVAVNTPPAQLRKGRARGIPTKREGASGAGLMLKYGTRWETRSINISVLFGGFLEL